MLVFAPSRSSGQEMHFLFTVNVSIESIPDQAASGYYLTLPSYPWSVPDCSHLRDQGVRVVERSDSLLVVELETIVQQL